MFQRLPALIIDICVLKQCLQHFGVETSGYVKLHGIAASNMEGLIEVQTTRPF